MVNNGRPPPVPFSATFSVGFSGSLVAMDRVADSRVVSVGVNVTPITQLEFAARVPAQALEATAKSIPAMDRLYVTDALPAFESVTFRAGLSVLSGTVPNGNTAGDTDVVAP